MADTAWETHQRLLDTLMDIRALLVGAYNAHQYDKNDTNNLREVDFDKEKGKGMTFAQWAEIYLERFAKGKRSFHEDRRYVKPFLISLATCRLHTSPGRRWKNSGNSAKIG